MDTRQRQELLLARHEEREPIRSFMSTSFCTLIVPTRRHIFGILGRRKIAEVSIVHRVLPQI